nr:MAG TPA: hypothetical protein [Caudoviricetes sp.]DAO32627.1 MAG TPA: hypothetical protein [Caudoviricetes sp.]
MERNSLFLPASCRVALLKQGMSKKSDRERKKGTGDGM